jgi:hypothetical protein
MTCPECDDRNKTSIVYLRSTKRTDLGFTASDPAKGTPHLHDPNLLTEQYECSNGHRFKRVLRVACPSCDHGHEAPLIAKLTPRAKYKPGMAE